MHVCDKCMHACTCVETVHVMNVCVSVHYVCHLDVVQSVLVDSISRSLPLQLEDDHTIVMT